jgi:hypothetical protein
MYSNIKKKCSESSLKVFLCLATFIYGDCIAIKRDSLHFLKIVKSQGILALSVIELSVSC